MRPCWKKEKVEETERNIRANDVKYNSQFNYASNHIKTSKYNVVTFLPKNLFEQFQRIANAYFLGLLILQLIPQISSLTPFTTIIPLVAVLGLTAIKDGYDDLQRHRSDNQVNGRKSYVLRDGSVVEERWENVVVGDIIRMESNQFVAADLFLLSTSEPNSLCYIETAELDGETNLKVKQALPETAEMGDDFFKMSEFTADIRCEPPNNRLNRFEGTMKWNGETFSIDNEKMLLRGCVLRNTKWCYGLVIFAGQDTKLMMNSGKAQFKRTNIDRLMNVLVVGIFLFLCCVCLICMIACGVWETVTGYNFQQYLPWEDFVPGGTVTPDKSEEPKESGATVIALMVFLSYIIILNTVVPISLYVSVEMIRLGNSIWINWDEKMYHLTSDCPAKARTTTLNEELGQIEYIFSDKTGTLTQNIMAFKKCSIDSQSYGDAYDDFGNQIDVTEKTPVVDLSYNPMAEKGFQFYDNSLIEEIQNRNPTVHQFFRLLALCHTVMPEEKDGKLEYQAQSPDEGALVSAARNFGFVFKSRTPTTITIEVLGKTEVYELLCILDFNNVRKRMSVIVRKDNKIQLLCKGADSLVNERLDPSCAELKELNGHHLNEFAQDGLRTLCCAVKNIDEGYYNQWKQKYHEAATSLEDREDRVAEVYEEIEANMTLIGSTAIEDKLQDGVPDAIANLALAGIKIWVLTGDKQETAINIGYSSRLLTDEMEEIFVVDGDTDEDVKRQLSDAKKHLTDMMERHHPDKVAYQNGGYVSHGEDFGTEEQGGYALVINGHSLVYALKREMEMLLLEVGCLCKAVICCRVTPLQKALVVDLVKRNKQSITLAIGDGANDVSMIKMAHIGVGISGQEGLQAVLASDYSIAQFRFVERLLLVHGRWSYLRMCKFLKYFFYKNFAFTLCHFWFAFFCGFSAQTLFDQYFITLYNVFYTSLPILALGAFDQDVNEYYSVRYPKLYTPGHLDLLFNKKVFLLSVGEGIVTSLVLFFVPYGAFSVGVNPWGQDVSDQQSFGVVVASILVVAVNLRCAIDTSYWTFFNHLFIWGSIIFYFCFILVFYHTSIGYVYMGTSYAVFSTATFWFSLLLTNVLLIIPVVAYRFFVTNITPSLTDRVRVRQRYHKSKSKSRDIISRRQSSVRRSTRSLRSGYAFAHQEGFGELITSGLNMRQRVSLAEKSYENGDPVKLTGLARIESVEYTPPTARAMYV